MLSIEIDGLEHNLFYASWNVDNVGNTWDITISGEDVGRHTGVELVAKVDKFMEAGYSRCTIFLEDTILVIPEPGTLIGFDTITGHRESSIGNHALNIMAVITIALAGDENPQADDLYPFAEEAIKGWLTECRPIP